MTVFNARVWLDGEDEKDDSILVRNIWGPRDAVEEGAKKIYDDSAGEAFSRGDTIEVWSQLLDFNDQPLGIPTRFTVYIDWEPNFTAIENLEK